MILYRNDPLHKWSRNNFQFLHIGEFNEKRYEGPRGVKKVWKAPRYENHYNQRLKPVNFEWTYSNFLELSSLIFVHYFSRTAIPSRWNFHDSACI